MGQKTRKYLKHSDLSFDFDFVAFRNWMLVDKRMSAGVASDMCTYLRKVLVGMTLRRPGKEMVRDFFSWREGKDSGVRMKGFRASRLATAFLASKGGG